MSNKEKEDKNKIPRAPSPEAPPPAPPAPPVGAIPVPPPAPGAIRAKAVAPSWKQKQAKIEEVEKIFKFRDKASDMASAKNAIMENFKKNSFDGLKDNSNRFVQAFCDYFVGLMNAFKSDDDILQHERFKETIKNVIEVDLRNLKKYLKYYDDKSIEIYRQYEKDLHTQQQIANGYYINQQLKDLYSKFNDSLKDQNSDLKNSDVRNKLMKIITKLKFAGTDKFKFDQDLITEIEQKLKTESPEPFESKKEPGYVKDAEQPKKGTLKALKEHHEKQRAAKAAEAKKEIKDEDKIIIAKPLKPKK